MITRFRTFQKHGPPKTDCPHGCDALTLIPIDSGNVLDGASNEALLVPLLLTYHLLPAVRVGSLRIMGCTALMLFGFRDSCLGWSLMLLGNSGLRMLVGMTPSPLLTLRGPDQGVRCGVGDTMRPASAGAASDSWENHDVDAQLPCTGQRDITHRQGRVGGWNTALPPRLRPGPPGGDELPDHIKQGTRTIRGLDGYQRSLLLCTNCGRVGSTHRTSFFLRNHAGCVGGMDVAPCPLP